RGVPFAGARMNATRAQEQFARLYDSRTAALVRERYAEDFARFGYSTDLADARASPERLSLTTGAGGGDALLCWLATGTAPEGAASDKRGAFLEFRRTRETRKRLNIVRRAIATEHSWAHLEHYLKFVRSKSRDRTLGDAIVDRMATLRRRYAMAVS